MKLDHPRLVDLLQRAYSAEKAAAFAYQGQAASLPDEDYKRRVQEIENDEWNHRREVLAIMQTHGVPIRRWYEIRFHLVGKMIAASCFVLGAFMPFYFAGRLESGNVCEYFRMMRYFHELGIHDHDRVLYEMGMKEKDHEVYFLDRVRGHRFLPFFERFFDWGEGGSFNNVDLDAKYPVSGSDAYCPSPTIGESGR